MCISSSIASLWNKSLCPFAERKPTLEAITPIVHIHQLRLTYGSHTDLCCCVLWWFARQIWVLIDNQFPGKSGYDPQIWNHYLGYFCPLVACRTASRSRALRGHAASCVLPGCTAQDKNVGLLIQILSRKIKTPWQNTKTSMAHLVLQTLSDYTDHSYMKPLWLI